MLFKISRIKIFQFSLTFLHNINFPWLRVKFLNFSVTLKKCKFELQTKTLPTEVSSNMWRSSRDELKEQTSKLLRPRKNWRTNKRKSTAQEVNLNKENSVHLPTDNLPFSTSMGVRRNENQWTIFTQFQKTIKIVDYSLKLVGYFILVNLFPSRLKNGPW